MGACSYVLTFFIECHKAVRLVSSFHHAYWWRQPVETQDFASPMEPCAIYPGYNQRVFIAFVACETQNFASHKEVCAINSCYNQRVVIAFPACETQDFASLLYMSRFFLYASFAPPQYEKSYDTKVVRHHRMEYSVMCIPY